MLHELNVQTLRRYDVCFLPFASVACELRLYNFGFCEEVLYGCSCLPCSTRRRAPLINAVDTAKSCLTFADGEPVRVLIFPATSRLGCYEDITCHSHEARIIFPSTLFSIFIVVISRLLPFIRGSEALLRLAVRLHATRSLRRRKKSIRKTPQQAFSEVVPRP